MPRRTAPGLQKSTGEEGRTDVHSICLRRCPHPDRALWRRAVASSDRRFGAGPLSALRQKFPKSDWESIDEVILGCVNQAGEDNRNVARMASLLPESRICAGRDGEPLCGSGMEAFQWPARAIAAGEISLAIAGGVESMSRSPFVIPEARRPSRATRKFTIRPSAGAL